MHPNENVDFSSLPNDEEYEYEYVDEEVDADGEYEYEYVEEEVGEEVAADGEYEYEYVEEEVAAGDLDADGEYEYEYVEEEVAVGADGVEYEYVEEEIEESVTAAVGVATAGGAATAVAAAPRVVASDEEYEYQEEEYYEEDIEPEAAWSAKREVPAWAVSLVVHGALFAALGMMTRYIPQPQIIPPITSVVEELKPEDFKFDATVVDVIGSDSQINIISPSKQASTKMGETPQEIADRQLDESFNLDAEPPVPEIVEPHESEFADAVELNGATEHVGGTEGALDRLAMEIAASVKEDKTLVAWVFDASQSLTKQREAIADRFENVYKQVGQLDVLKDKKALMTGIVSYGQVTNFPLEYPVHDIDQAAEAIRNIKDDTSGKEMVFTAVNQVARKWLPYRTKLKHKMMIIIVTDERGDDYLELEETIAFLARYGIKVYVVGPACILGREENYVEWTYEDGFTEELPVDGGPETLRPERVALGFWGVGSRDLEKMSAGYGPYALTRLAAETGGMYLINKESRGPRFDPNVMKNYLPDYRPIRDYMAQLQQNAAKNALVNAAEASQKRDVPSPRLSFDADTDTILRNQLTEAQRPIAVYDAYLDEMLALLEPGERDAEKLDTPRWQAGFYLSVGRLYALKARVYGYNAAAAAMKSSPKSFTKPGSNSWRMVAADAEFVDPRQKKFAKKASQYLTKVIDQHAGTPWALLAERELSQPMGWDWVEFKAPRPENNGMRNNNNNNNVQLADDEMPERNRNMMQNRPQRKKPNL